MAGVAAAGVRLAAAGVRRADGGFSAERTGMGFSRDGADGEGLPHSFFGEGSGFGRPSTAQHRHRQSAARAARRSLSWPKLLARSEARRAAVRALILSLRSAATGKAGFVTSAFAAGFGGGAFFERTFCRHAAVSVRESASDFIILRRSSAWRVAVPFATASSFSTSARRSLACSTSASSRCCVDAPIAAGEPGCGSGDVAAWATAAPGCGEVATSLARDMISAIDAAMAAGEVAACAVVGSGVAGSGEVEASAAAKARAT